MIERLDAKGVCREREALSELLLDAVRGGATVGFDSDDPEVARAFWEGVGEDVAAGRLRILVARVEGRVVGTVQLRFASYPNGRHRAEVAKLLVHSSLRRQGVARALMGAVEELARKEGKTLLFLDTETGSGAESLYRALGWTVVGVIPDFASTPRGGLSGTTIHYKRLG